MDRGYIDFARLYMFTLSMAFFIIRAKSNLDYGRRSYCHVDKSTGLRSDQTIVLKGPKTSEGYPIPLRRISYFDADTNKRLVFLTNNFMLPALTIPQLYKCRWRVELFFQMDKAVPSNQGVFRHVGERGKDSDMDCNQCLRACCHHQEGVEARPEFGRNPANSQHFTFRKSLCATITCDKSVAKGGKRPTQPVVLVQLITGQ